MIKEHTERKDNCERFTQEAARKLQRARGSKMRFIGQQKEKSQIGKTSTGLSTMTSRPQSSQKMTYKNKLANLVKKLPLLNRLLQEVIRENEKRERHNTRVGIILEQTARVSKSDLMHSNLNYQVKKNTWRHLKRLRKHFLPMDYWHTK